MDKQRAIDDWPLLVDYCASHGLEPAMSAPYTHWRIYQRPNLIAEWWPRSDKLVLHRNYHAPIFVDSVERLIEELGAR